MEGDDTEHGKWEIGGKNGEAAEHSGERETRCSNAAKAWGISENIMRRMRSDIKREYVVFSKGLDEQERKEKWKRNGGKVEERIRPSEGVILLLRRDRAVRVKDHQLATKRAILLSIRT